MNFMQDQKSQEPPPYVHIIRNEFLHRKHKKQKEEDISTCECLYSADDPESACGERCLNFLTSTECTPGHCLCGEYCKNQRFQRSEYVKLKLVRTEGRGWGLLADEDVKSGQFVIEYCGEVISWKEAKRRSQAYEAQGQIDAYIISLNGHESIDATRKGSLARFINHSCQPNCETRKWHVLGEVRVGIFAKEDICAGTELSYNYNFEWYGGNMVRCLCGAASCSGFLGAKSRGFQEASYVWEDDDDRFSVENLPLYDSADDDVLSKPTVLSVDASNSEHMLNSSGVMEPANSIFVPVEPLEAIPAEVYGGAEVMEDICVEDYGVTEVVVVNSSTSDCAIKNLACGETDPAEGIGMIPSESKSDVANSGLMDIEINKDGADGNSGAVIVKKLPVENSAVNNIKMDGVGATDVRIKNEIIDSPVMNTKTEEELNGEADGNGMASKVEQERATSVVLKNEHGNGVCVGEGRSSIALANPNATQRHNESSNALENHHNQLIPFGAPRKKPKKVRGKKQLNTASICKILPSDKAREVLECEAVKKRVASVLDDVYNEIKPMVEDENNRDDIGSMPMDVAVMWINATCDRYKADADFYSTMVEKLYSSSQQRRKVGEQQ